MSVDMTVAIQYIHIYTAIQKCKSGATATPWELNGVNIALMFCSHFVSKPKYHDTLAVKFHGGLSKPLCSRASFTNHYSRIKLVRHGLTDYRVLASAQPPRLFGAAHSTTRCDCVLLERIVICTMW